MVDLVDPSQIKIDSTVSFDLYPAATLMASVKNARVLSVVNARTAMQLGYDAPAYHAVVYPSLPPGTPNAYDKYQYVGLKLPSGQETFIGVPWIKASTYVEESLRDITLRIQGVTPEQQTRIIQALSAIGHPVASIEVDN